MLAINLNRYLNLIAIANMKYILILLLALSSNAFAQTYKFGAIMSSGMNVKMEGSIIIKDSSVKISNGTKTNEYKLVKDANGIIYFTDDVMTHYFTIIPQTGKKKGFEYDTMISWFLDKRMGGEPIIYWCKKEAP